MFHVSLRFFLYVLVFQQTNPGVIITQQLQIVRIHQAQN